MPAFVSTAPTAQTLHGNRQLERVQRTILNDYSNQILLRQSSPDPSGFDRRFVVIPDFSSEATFQCLRETIESARGSQRVHLPIHKRGAAISYTMLHEWAPVVVAFYHSQTVRD